MGFFERMLDFTYRFVKREGDFSLQLFADFIRGPSIRRDEKIEKSKSEIPLTYDENKIFQELLKRKQGEDQVAYWKRKKAMLNMADKKGFVQQEIQLRQQQTKGKNKEQVIGEQIQKRKLEAQMQRIKSAKYNSLKNQSGQKKRM